MDRTGNANAPRAPASILILGRPDGGPASALRAGERGAMRRCPPREYVLRPVWEAVQTAVQTGSGSRVFQQQKEQLRVVRDALRGAEEQHTKLSRSMVAAAEEYEIVRNEWNTHRLRDRDEWNRVREVDWRDELLRLEDLELRKKKELDDVKQRFEALNVSLSEKRHLYNARRDAIDDYNLDWHRQRIVWATLGSWCSFATGAVLGTVNWINSISLQQHLVESGDALHADITAIRSDMDAAGDAARGAAEGRGAGAGSTSEAKADAARAGDQESDEASRAAAGEERGAAAGEERGAAAGEERGAAPGAPREAGAGAGSRWRRYVARARELLTPKTEWQKGVAAGTSAGVAIGAALCLFAVRALSQPSSGR